MATTDHLIQFPDGHLETHTLDDGEDDYEIPRYGASYNPARETRVRRGFEIPGYNVVIRENGRLYAVDKEKPS